MTFDAKISFAGFRGQRSSDKAKEHCRKEKHKSAESTVLFAMSAKDAKARYAERQHLET